MLCCLSSSFWPGPLVLFILPSLGGQRLIQMRQHYGPSAQQSSNQSSGNGKKSCTTVAKGLAGCCALNNEASPAKKEKGRDIQKLREIDRARHGTRKERQWIGRKASGKASELGKRVEVESVVYCKQRQTSRARSGRRCSNRKNKGKQNTRRDLTKRGRREKEKLESIARQKLRLGLRSRGPGRPPGTSKYFAQIERGREIGGTGA